MHLAKFVTVIKRHMKCSIQFCRLMRFEKTNEMLLNFNILSKARFETTQHEFKKHTQLLAEMKMDLDQVFKRIRYVT